MAFTQENYGKPISEQLSYYLRKYTGNHDRADVSVKTGVGTSTIRDVSYRNNALTEENSKAITELVRKAIENCQSNITESAEAVEVLKELLN